MHARSVFGSYALNGNGPLLPGQVPGLGDGPLFSTSFNAPEDVLGPAQAPADPHPPWLNAGWEVVSVRGFVRPADVATLPPQDVGDANAAFGILRAQSGEVMLRVRRMRTGKEVLLVSSGLPGSGPVRVVWFLTDGPVVPPFVKTASQTIAFKDIPRAGIAVVPPAPHHADPAPHHDDPIPTPTPKSLVGWWWLLPAGWAAWYVATDKKRSRPRNRRVRRNPRGRPFHETLAGVFLVGLASDILANMITQPKAPPT